MSFFMKFNNIVFPGRITSVEGRGLLKYEVTRREQVRVPGSFYQKNRIPERILIVHFTIYTDGLSFNRNLTDEWNGILNVSQPVPITFTDEPNKTYYGIPIDETKWDEKVNRIVGSLNILCPDPHKYGAEKTLTVSTSAIVNKGTTETNLIFTITFTKAASEFKITHQQSGKWVRVIYNFIAGDKLVIDLEKRKITVNNTLKMTSYDWKSQPFNLLPGANTFSFAPNNAVTATIKYRERWL